MRQLTKRKLARKQISTYILTKCVASLFLEHCLSICAPFRLHTKVVLIYRAIEVKLRIKQCKKTREQKQFWGISPKRIWRFKVMATILVTAYSSYGPGGDLSLVKFNHWQILHDHINILTTKVLLVQNNCRDSAWLCEKNILAAMLPPTVSIGSWGI